MKKYLYKDRRVQLGTRGQQEKNNGELQKGKGRGKKKTKSHAGGSGLQLGFMQVDDLKTRKLGGALVGAGLLLPFFRLYSPSCTQKRYFIYLFLQNLFKFSFLFPQLIKRLNVRLKGGFASTRRWVLKASPWALSMLFWIIKLNVSVQCFFSSGNPTNKTVPGTAYMWELLIANHLDESLCFNDQKY